MSPFSPSWCVPNCLQLYVTFAFGFDSTDADAAALREAKTYHAHELEALAVLQVRAGASQAESEAAYDALSEAVARGQELEAACLAQQEKVQNLTLAAEKKHTAAEEAQAVAAVALGAAVAPQ